MKIRLVLLFLLFAATAGPCASGLEQGFLNPPESTKPWCYWYWISDNISQEGITRDLEAMKRVGIGEAFIGNIFLDDVKIGNVKALSDEWWGMVEHAIREGGRIGVDIGMFNCPGWSQSGGPWIKPEQAMRYIASSEQRVKGPVLFEEKLPTPKAQFQQIAVLAFRAARADADVIGSHSPSISCTPEVSDSRGLADGDRKTAVMFPTGAGEGTNSLAVLLATDEPFTARSLEVVPAPTDFSAQCELQAGDEDGSFRTLRKFPIDRSNNSLGVGFLPHSPVAISFPPAKSTKFRLIFSAVHGKAGVAEIELSGAARVERYIEKQLGKMHPTPLPLWDAYLWPGTAEVDSPDLAVNPADVRDLTSQVASDGKLRWEVPEGDWLIVRLGMTPTGMKNAPASPEGQGLEVDKMNRAAAQAHFDAFIGEVLRRVPASARKAFRHVVADSYEMGSQNWTDGFRDTFQKRYGYDPQPWLPVLTGRVVGNSDLSDRFLWDLRRLVADHVAADYVGGLREACRKTGLKLWLENYGHWGFPAEFLQYGGQTDEVSGEFWATGDLGSIELRAASSAAHIYGKPVVHAEAFTSVLRFESTPWSLKRRGDWALTEGVNHWVLHVNIHQPWEDRLPGVNAWFSTEFNRHNTWFEAGREWIDYYRRCDFLLQQGRHVADVAYFIGEDTPKMTGIRKPELPAGYDFDYINAEVLQNRVQVKNGNLVLPDGTTYRLLVLPELPTMRPELLAKIQALVKAGGSILGAPPSRSPSMQNYPRCDRDVQKMATELWQDCDGRTNTQTQFGKGHVFRGMELRPVLDRLKTGLDISGLEPKQILWTHRTSTEAEIYFLCNQSEQRVRVAPLFRVSGKQPELWDAAGRQTLRTAVFENADEGTRVPVDLEPRGSVFVIFRERAGRAAPVIEVRRDKEVLISTHRAPETFELVVPARSRLPASAFSLRPITLLRDRHGLVQAEISSPGVYTLRYADRIGQSVAVSDLPAPLELAGPWQVDFPPQRDVPGRITLERLLSLTDQPDEAIRYFSGTATYRNQIPFSGERAPGRRLLLDLGRVEAVAEVTVNGRNLGILWKPPFVVDVTRAIRSGPNELIVQVTGTWRNRLIGDAKYPKGFPGRGETSATHSLEFKPSLTADLKLSPTEALSPFGLLGPVRLFTTQSVPVRR